MVQANKQPHAEISTGKRSILSFLIKALVLAAVGIVLLRSGAALADDARLSITPDQELQFGDLVTTGGGYREVSPQGQVLDVGLVSLSTGTAHPARVTVRYDRGDNSRDRLNLRIQMTFTASQSDGGGAARISRFQTDLPNGTSFAPGQIVELQIADCVTRICERTFNLGARLQVDPQFKGSQVAIPVGVDATLISTE